MGNSFGQLASESPDFVSNSDSWVLLRFTKSVLHCHWMLMLLHYSAICPHLRKRTWKDSRRWFIRRVEVDPKGQSKRTHERLQHGKHEEWCRYSGLWPERRLCCTWGGEWTGGTPDGAPDTWKSWVLLRGPCDTLKTGRKLSQGLWSLCCIFLHQLLPIITAPSILLNYKIIVNNIFSNERR